MGLSAASSAASSAPFSANSVDTFFLSPGPILDVRSPGEYDQGHIPGAISFPLFSNGERAAIGTCYKQQGRDAAVELGLEQVGPKMAGFVRQAKQLALGGQVRLHCWRGGMRSSSMGWLLTTAGLEATVLEGGYKTFRRWVRSSLSQPQSICIVGGMTGTGKTLILDALQQLGEQVLNLEALANHRGSSYGSLGLPPQPSTEQFENLIAMAWRTFDPQCPLWVEAESAQVGRCRVPPEVFEQMERSPILEVQRTQAERVALLRQVYGEASPLELITATQRISRRLGTQRTQAAIQWIDQGKLEPAIKIILEYYDKAYGHDLGRRPVPRQSVDVAGLSPVAAAQRLMRQSQF
ncbi:MAG: tRNA 2-selenouridine(34) synthase MnmH [Synechococcales cyanobacterium CRU_2_2]|nr:tRNA 2-selenouridine(34) synthase MnmH [Synechococcales cyanobacterium CRU_2_2]